MDVLSLQRSCCDSPKPCSSGEGPGGTGHCVWPVSLALPPALGEGFTAAPRADTKAARALGPVVRGPGLLSSSSTVAEGHGLFLLLLRKQWRGKL